MCERQAPEASGQVNASLVILHSPVHDNSLKIREGGRGGEEKEGRKKERKRKKVISGNLGPLRYGTGRKKEIEGDEVR